MELKLYFRILLKRWWIVLITFFFTLIPTYIFVNGQPWIYETEATFVMRPRADIAANGDEVVKALDTISRRVEINTTFAEVSSSSLIKAQAIQRLGLSAEERRGLKVSGRVIAGTNILEISVQGPDPQVVRDFANAVSAETVAYVSSLYDVFELEPLDAADLPSDPISPNKTLNLALGGGFGLFLGIGLIFFVEYLREPVQSDYHVNIIDPETGAYNHAYFMLRLRQEVSRARHNGYASSLALIKIYNRGIANDLAQPIQPAKALRLLLTSLEPNIREEDIFAYLGQNIFALLLPHMPDDAAKDLMSFLRNQIGLIPPGQIGETQTTTLCCAVGLVITRLHSTPNELLNQATEALQEAETAVYGKVQLYTPPTQPGRTLDDTASISKLFSEARR